jgi:Domain of unknown function (DUF4193)
MTVDYDAPLANETDEPTQRPLPELAARHDHDQAGLLEPDEADAAESFELPGADLADEQLTVRVIPKQADEFTCSVCFLVHHRSQLADSTGDQMVCAECAS